MLQLTSRVPRLKAGTLLQLSVSKTASHSPTKAATIRTHSLAKHHIGRLWVPEKVGFGGGVDVAIVEKGAPQDDDPILPRSGIDRIKG